MKALNKITIILAIVIVLMLGMTLGYSIERKSDCSNRPTEAGVLTCLYQTGQVARPTPKSTSQPVNIPTEQLKEFWQK